MIDVHQNVSESFEGDRSRVIGNRCKRKFEEIITLRKAMKA